jgi:hypothetical protein
MLNASYFLNLSGPAKNSSIVRALLARETFILSRQPPFLQLPAPG